MNPWMDAIDKLRLLGYSVSLDGERLRYAYQGMDNPRQDEIIILFEVLKAHKAEILKDPCFLIEQTTQELNKAWKPGALTKLKSKPEERIRMLDIENKVNEVALARDIDGLKKALKKYKGLFSVMDSGEVQRNLFDKQDVV
jgi:hypothetical protein